MQQIANWLKNLGMSEYAQRFVENDIATLALYRELVPFGNSKYVHKIRQARLPRFYMDRQKLSSNDERRPSLKNDDS